MLRDDDDNRKSFEQYINAVVRHKFPNIQIDDIDIPLKLADLEEVEPFIEGNFFSYGPSGCGGAAGVECELIPQRVAEACPLTEKDLFDLQKKWLKQLAEKEEWIAYWDKIQKAQLEKLQQRNLPSEEFLAENEKINQKLAIVREKIQFAYVFRLLSEITTNFRQTPEYKNRKKEYDVLYNTHATLKRKKTIHRTVRLSTMVVKEQLENKNKDQDEAKKPKKQLKEKKQKKSNEYLGKKLNALMYELVPKYNQDQTGGITGKRKHDVGIGKLAIMFDVSPKLVPQRQEIAEADLAQFPKTLVEKVAFIENELLKIFNDWKIDLDQDSSVIDNIISQKFHEKNGYGLKYTYARLLIAALHAIYDDPDLRELSASPEYLEEHIDKAIFHPNIRKYQTIKTPSDWLRHRLTVEYTGSCADELQRSIFTLEKEIMDQPDDKLFKNGMERECEKFLAYTKALNTFAKGFSKCLLEKDRDFIEKTFLDIHQNYPDLVPIPMWDSYRLADYSHISTMNLFPPVLKFPVDTHVSPMQRFNLQ